MNKPGKLNRQQRRERAKLQKRYKTGLLAEARRGNWGDWESRNVNDPVALSAAKQAGNNTRPAKMLVNNLFSVQYFYHATEWGEVTQLTIRRHDADNGAKGRQVSWADKQRIKDELVGGRFTAIEVFPSQENLVDQANLYHLWVLPEDMELPFGLHFKGWSRSGAPQIQGLQGVGGGDNG